jgi:hypothetical protein
MTFEELCRWVVKTRIEKEQIQEKLQKKMLEGAECKDFMLVDVGKLKDMLRQTTCATCICRNYCFDDDCEDDCWKVKIKYLKGEIEQPLEY